MACTHFIMLTALAANPDLERAVKLIGDLQYPEAQKALDAASRRQGNDRESMVRLYELQGVVFATLNDAARAQKAFQTMLVLDPDRKLTGDHPPRVMTPFYEAKGRAVEVGKLELRALPAALSEGKVSQLAVELVSDPLKMVKKLRFHARLDGGPWAEIYADLVGKTASVAVDAKTVQWWAEAVGERDGALFEVGTEAAPRQESAQTAVAGNDAPTEKPLTPSKPPDSTVTASSGVSGITVASVVLLAVGAVTLAVGAVFGVISSNARGKLNDLKIENGLVTNLTQREAFALDQTVKTNATLANVFFAAGGALALGGAVLLVVSNVSSSSTPTTVSIAPAGSGVVLSGTW